MAINYDSQTKTKAAAAVHAELEKISRNFGRSLRLCNEAAELLIMGAGKEFDDIRRSKLKQTCSLFRHVPSEANRALRIRT